MVVDDVAHNMVIAARSCTQGNQNMVYDEMEYWTEGNQFGQEVALKYFQNIAERKINYRT